MEKFCNLLLLWKITSCSILQNIETIWLFFNDLQLDVLFIYIGLFFESYINFRMIIKISVCVCKLSITMTSLVIKHHSISRETILAHEDRSRRSNSEDFPKIVLC